MATNTAAYSIRLRVRLDNRPGTLGHARDGHRRRRGQHHRPRGLRCPRRPPRRGRARQLLVRGAHRAGDGGGRAPSMASRCSRSLTAPSRCTRAARSRSSLACPSPTATTSRWPTRRAWPGSARRSRAEPAPGPRAHDQEEHRRHRHRRHRGARPRRHRPGRRPAGHGGQGAALQELRRRRRVPDLPRRHRPPTRSSRPSCGSRRSFGGINLEDIAAPALLRDRGAPRRSCSTSPCSTTTSTAPRSSRWRRCENALRIVDKPMTTLKVVIAGVGAAGVAISKILHGGRGAPTIIGVDRKGAIWEGRDDLNVAKQWFAEHTNPERRAGHPRRGPARCRRVHRRVGAGADHGRRPAADGTRSDRVRHGQPRSRDPARGGRRARRGHGHRAQRLPQPDQQRAGLPRHLPGRARRRRATTITERHEAGRGAGHRRRWSATTSVPTTSSRRCSTRGSGRSWPATSPRRRSPRASAAPRSPDQPGWGRAAAGR